MKVLVAESAGFCFGVERAVNTVYEQIKNHQGEKIYTLGPIIHNEEVVKELAQLGVEILRNEDEIQSIHEGVVIIRSHGVTKAVYEQIENQGLTVIDATCPFVKKIHRIAQEQSEKGAFLIIIGDESHVEVQGILGWVPKNQAMVIQNHEDIAKLGISLGQHVCIVAQTTFNYNKFQDLVEIISEKGYDVSVLNTICNATKQSQQEARCIAEQVDAMIVIGDKHSSNTQKLFEICKNACKATYYIQTLDDLNFDQLGSVETVGITAGASTPNNIIEEVQKYVRADF